MQQDIASRNGYLYWVTCAAVMAGRIENESVIEYPMAMRSVLLRWLVVLLALTFVGGATVNARAHSMPSGAECALCRDAADAGTSVNKSA